MKKGISLIVMLITIVVIIILAASIINTVIYNSPMDNAKEATFRSDLQEIKNAYGIRQGDLMIKYKGDKSKIKEEDYVGVVHKNYTGEIQAFDVGLAYLGKDKKKQEIAESMDYIIGNPNDSVLKVWWNHGNEDFHTEEYRKKITKIKLITNNKVSKDAIKSWDVSEKNNGSVMAWIVDDGNEGYELIIGGNGKIIANKDSRAMFSGFSKAKEIDINVLDTSNVMFMNSMFDGCSSLTNLNLGDKFVTSSVTTMLYMFSGCSSLISLDLSNLDTSNVTNMMHMFYGCASLTNLDLSNLDTKNVINMDSMFWGCSNLISVNLGKKFNTSSVTDMYMMFCGCRSLISLDFSNLDLSKVKNMRHMFQQCNKLKSINYSNKFNISAIENMDLMFNGCSSLTSLDLSSFDTSNVISMHHMFNSCSSLTSLNLGEKFDTSSVTDMNNMFNGCSNLTSLNLGERFDTSSVTNMSNMFWVCQKIKTNITIRNAEVTSYDGMFGGAATASGAEIIVNYTSETSDLVDEMIKTGSKNVKKGKLVS